MESDMTKLEKEKNALEKCAERLVPTDASLNLNVEDQIKPCLTKLNEMIKNADENENIVTNINADVLCCLTQEDNPFTKFPWDTSKNIFTEILNFGIKHTPLLIKLIATLARTDKGLEAKGAVKVAVICLSL